VIPGGRCAVLRVVGGSENLEAPALFLYRDWLPASGEETRDFSLFRQRVSFYPDVPEHETITDLFLPLKWPWSLPSTKSRFSARPRAPPRAAARGGRCVSRLGQAPGLVDPDA
jgi:hypothetical protein